MVIVELAVIRWIRWKYMDTPPLSAALQVGFGGALVFATGILIGSQLTQPSPKETSQEAAGHASAGPKHRSSHE